jgi:hypothetical protein
MEHDKCMGVYKTMTLTSLWWNMASCTQLVFLPFSWPEYLMPKDKFYSLMFCIIVNKIDTS